LVTGLVERAEGPGYWHNDVSEMRKRDDELGEEGGEDNRLVILGHGTLVLASRFG